MGGDGGSIPKRDDLVKVKAGDQKAEKKSRDRQLWSTCALSKEPLRAPIVSCPLGKLYNKESLISYLLHSPSSDLPAPFGNEGSLIAGHIRSLKDITTLSLTPNPALKSQSTEEAESSSHIGTQESRPTALFVCPISLREMNGSIKFVYRRPCGCVLSDASLREMRRNEEGGKVCPVTGTEEEGEEEWITLNPKDEELDAMKVAWEARKVAEKEAKRLAKGSRKRATGEDDLPKAKKVKSTIKPLSEAPALRAGSSVPLLSATLAAKIAEQKKAHSPAIASLYARKNADSTHDAQGRSNWMVQGTFTRHA